MAKTIAKITGTALRPGVSRNGRLYTKELIAGAVDRAQARILSGESPLTMLTHHMAGDDSTQIVGRLASLTVAPDGSAKYEAHVADTSHGRTIVSLVDNADGPPFLKNVSIRGAWLGKVTYTKVGDQTAEVGEGLELDGLDFTRSPGVAGADVDSVKMIASLPTESVGRSLIYETAPKAQVTFTEDFDGNVPSPQVKPKKYADPGYLSDKSLRYPLDTKEQAMETWSAINQRGNASKYTPAQIHRINTRVETALRGFGVKIDTNENWLITTEHTPVTEYADEPVSDYARPGSFSVNIDNGMVSINISSYQVDPADLEVAASAAMKGACAALAQMDPDSDGDIDTPTGDITIPESTEPTNPVTEAEEFTEADTEDEETGAMADQPTSPAADTPQGTTTTGAAETTATAPAPAAAPVISLTQDQFAQLLSTLKPAAPAAVAGVAAPAPVAEQPVAVGAESAAPGAPVATETAGPATVPNGAVTTTEAAPAKTMEQMIAEGIATGIAAHFKTVAETAEGGGVLRKGLVAERNNGSAGTAVADSEYPEGWPADPAGNPKAPHELTNEQWKQFSRPAVERSVMGHRSVYNTQQ